MCRSGMTCVVFIGSQRPLGTVAVPAAVYTPRGGADEGGVHSEWWFGLLWRRLAVLPRRRQLSGALVLPALMMVERDDAAQRRGVVATAECTNLGGVRPCHAGGQGCTCVTR